MGELKKAVQKKIKKFHIIVEGGKVPVRTASNYSADERREKAKSDVMKLGKWQSFSQVYSKQYSQNTISNYPTQDIKETNMDEFYQLIEKKIKASGYLGTISGFDIYNEVNDFIEDKENGTYIFMSKPENDIIFEYHLDIYQDEFNLSSLIITTLEDKYHINFDE